MKLRALFRFRHFRTRLLVLLLAPLLAVLAAVYFIITTANTRNALNIITGDLARGAYNFAATIDLRNEALAITGDALSNDFATRAAYASGDAATILSALDNLLDRVELVADFIVMVDEQTGTVVADTLHPEIAGAAPDWLRLIEQARKLDELGEYPEAADVIVLDAHPYHLTVLPFYSPDLIAWIGLGFEIGNDFTLDFTGSIASDLSVVFRDADGRWQSNGSTLPDAVLAELITRFDTIAAIRQSTIHTFAGEDYVTLASPISNDERSVYAVLQRSMTEQLAPFEALQQALLIIFVIGLLLIVLGLLTISRRVTRPVLQLADQARRIEAGDYQQRTDVRLHDEIGALAQAFNGMATGLAEKDKVRNLLGKVVSPEVARELLSRDIELGGEEREVTILFCDVRGFTSLCEGQAPKQVLSLLNEYFSAIAHVIESNGGVVDKYIGDAVMALFGAPVTQRDAAARAVRTAFGMLQALVDVNASFTARGLKPIAIGIGINSDKVVAGNMGSQSRLNYTVIGDGVNLASRLEGLTKRYGVALIVSEQCALAAPDFLYRELDLVRVKGKREPVRIFEPLHPAVSAPPVLAEVLNNFGAFLQAYREGRFAEASQLLDVCEATSLRTGIGTNLVLTNLYRDRLRELLSRDDSTAWDGVHTFDEK